MVREKCVPHHLPLYARTAAKKPYSRQMQKRCLQTPKKVMWISKSAPEYTLRTDEVLGDNVEFDEDGCKHQIRFVSSPLSDTMEHVHIEAKYITVRVGNAVKCFHRGRNAQCEYMGPLDEIMNCLAQSAKFHAIDTATEGISMTMVLADALLLACGGCCHYCETIKPAVPFFICGSLLNVFSKKDSIRILHMPKTRFHVKSLCSRACNAMTTELWNTPLVNSKDMFEDEKTIAVFDNFCAHLYNFASDALTHIDLHPEDVAYAAALIDRCVKCSGIPLLAPIACNLFVAAISLVCKLTHDDAPQNIGSIFSMTSVEQELLEMYVMAMLNCNIIVHEDDITHYLSNMSLAVSALDS